MEENQVILHLGSNLGDRSKNLEDAVQLIEEKIGILVERSRIFETEPWGVTSQPLFLNMALTLTSTILPNQVLQIIHQIESQLGRKRLARWDARLIDIDILYFNDWVIKSPILTIPHPYLQDRRFVLIPLLDIAPDFIHPTLQKNTKELLSLCTDSLKVNAFDNSKNIT